MNLSLCFQQKNDSLRTSKIVRITANSSLETMEGRGQWDGTFKIKKEKYNYQPRSSYPAQVFLMNQKQVKSFSF